MTTRTSQFRDIGDKHNSSGIRLGLNRVMPYCGCAWITTPKGVATQVSLQTDAPQITPDRAQGLHVGLKSAHTRTYTPTHTGPKAARAIQQHSCRGLLPHPSRSAPHVCNPPTSNINS